ncbi:MAG: anthranilate phosphoribosyltransferase [Candidatus Eremiobacteraeota bacterium]|nr:anthranilate phosphoribosyltransferase [Candidatus Eremiobacteraeota bacterium]
MIAAATAQRTTSISSHIRRAAAGTHLSADESREAVYAIMEGVVSPAQIAALLTALAIKGETVEEIAGAARAMRAHAVAVDADGLRAIDVCGTGGDGAGTFNISTAVAFVVAGAGVAVAKHGNRAMSSRCGSADVLEALGVRIDLAPQRTAEILRAHAIAFMFAQAHHPAMRHVAPVRRELGMRTMFNLLGPLTNPAGVKRQLVGVAHDSVRAMLALALGRLGSERAAVISGSDGLDEATLAGPTRVTEWTGRDTLEYEVVPEDVGAERAASTALVGGDATDNAAIVEAVLDGRRGPHRDVVILNAALALYIAGAEKSIARAGARAQRSIDSGAARGKLDELVRESN